MYLKIEFFDTSLWTFSNMVDSFGLIYTLVISNESPHFPYSLATLANYTVWLITDIDDFVEHLFRGST